MVHLDLVSLTLQFELDFKELEHLREQSSRPPALRDPTAIQLERHLLHEHAHLASFLGSGMARLHRNILDLQHHLTQGILWRVHESRLIKEVTVPLLDQHGMLFPNAVAAYPKLKIDVAAASYRELDTLNQFIMGYPPTCGYDTLMRAYQVLLCALEQKTDARLSRTTFAYIGTSRDPAEIPCFMREHHCLALLPQICNAWNGFGSPPPILPRIHASDVPGSDAPILISSRSVLEGLAVLGEVLGMRKQHASVDPARSEMSATYRAALVYCLHCINHVSGERYSLGQLLSGHLPDWAHVTMGAMLDLAIQIDMPEHPATDHTVLIEKCPAWRLLAIGASIKAQGVPLISPAAALDGHEIRDWQRDVCMKVGWTPRRYRSSTSVPIKDVTGADLFDHWVDTAANQRDQHQLLYLTGRTSAAKGGPLDFTAWETRDRLRIYLSGDHIQARRDFIETQRHKHYVTPALVVGHHWDHCWQRARVRIPQRHTASIARRLNDAVQTHPHVGHWPAASGRAFLADEIQVREEFNQVLGCDMDDIAAHD